MEDGEEIVDGELQPCARGGTNLPIRVISDVLRDPERCEHELVQNFRIPRSICVLQKPGRNPVAYVSVAVECS